MSSRQIVVLVLMLVAFAFIATHPEFRRRLGETPPVRRLSLLGLALLAVAFVIWIAGTTGIRL